MPTMICTEDNKVADRIEGFTDLGNTAAFTTDTLAKRLWKNGILEYVPDMSHMLGENSKTYNVNNKSGKAIYESKIHEMLREDDENDDWLYQDD